MSDLNASPAMVKDIMDETLFLSLDDYNDTVKIILGVGKEQLRLDFAVKVLGLHSEFFRLKTKCCSLLPHKDHPNQTIDLSNQNLDAMNAFLAWNTTGDIYSAKRLSKNTIPDDGIVTTKHLDGYRVLWDQLLECYFLADFLGAPNFGNAIIDALFDAIDNEREDRNKLKVEPEENILVNPLAPISNTTNNGNDLNEDLDEDDEFRDPFGETAPQQEVRQMLGTLPYQIQRMYSKTKAGSPVRKVLLDMIIKQALRRGPYQSIHGILEEAVPLEFNRNLVDQLMRTALISYAFEAADANFNYGITPSVRVMTKCFYHIHKVGERCSS